MIFPKAYINCALYQTLNNRIHYNAFVNQVYILLGKS